LEKESSSDVITLSIVSKVQIDENQWYGLPEFLNLPRVNSDFHFLGRFSVHGRYNLASYILSLVLGKRTFKSFFFPFDYI